MGDTGPACSDRCKFLVTIGVGMADGGGVGVMEMEFCGVTGPGRSIRAKLILLCGVEGGARAGIGGRAVDASVRRVAASCSMRWLLSDASPGGRTILAVSVTLYSSA
jgi:hypothetical protein